MTLNNNPTPSDGDNRGDDRPSRNTPDLVFPDAPQVAHHRLLLQTYFENCKHAFVGTNDLITDRREMPLEAPMIFDALETEYRRALAEKMHEFGMRGVADGLTCRMLHPVVAVGKGYTEYHLYVDVVNDRGRCFFTDIGAVQSFNSGPASVQLYATEFKKGELKIGLIRLVSAPAFREAVNDIIATPFEEIRDRPRSFVAFGWIMGAVFNHRVNNHGQASSRQREDLENLSLDEVLNFRWMGGRAPAKFQFQLRNAEYNVELQFNSKDKRPNVFVSEEFK